MFLNQIDAIRDGFALVFIAGVLGAVALRAWMAGRVTGGQIAASERSFHAAAAYVLVPDVSARRESMRGPGTDPLAPR